MSEYLIKADVIERLSEGIAKANITKQNLDKSINNGELTEFKSSVNTQLAENTTRLNESLKSVINLGESRWGVKADGITDDTVNFEKALQFASVNGCKIIMPNGTVKITRPIKVDYQGNGKDLPLSFTLEGIGGVSNSTSKSYGSRIVAYNIPDTRGAIELLGVNNSETTSTEITNIEISLDKDTCGELSFCLFIGDSRLFTIRRVKFVGYNNVLLRTGTSPNATSYATMVCKFDQCNFEVIRYLEWGGGRFNEKARFGFSIANERMFRTNNYNTFASDSISFDTCLFRGLVFSFITNAVYMNCMWLRGYAPIINIQNDTRFNKNFIDMNAIDTSIGLWCVGGRITLISPYFEETVKCIWARTLGGFSTHLNISNPTFICAMTSAVRELPNGDPVIFEYAIKSDSPTGFNSSLIVQGGVYSPGSGGEFTEGFIINNAFKILDVKNVVTSVSELKIIDNASLRKHIELYNKSKSNNLVLEFKGKVGVTTAIPLKDTDITEYVFDKDYLLTKVEYIVGGKLVENHGLNVRVDGVASFSINDLGSNYASNSYIEYLGGATTEMYTIKNIPYTNLKNYPSSQRKFSFTKGQKLEIHSRVEKTPSQAINTDLIVKMYFEG